MLDWIKKSSWWWVVCDVIEHDGVYVQESAVSGDWWSWSDLRPRIWAGDATDCQTTAKSVSLANISTGILLLTVLHTWCKTMRWVLRCWNRSRWSGHILHLRKWWCWLKMCMAYKIHVVFETSQLCTVCAERRQTMLFSATQTRKIEDLARISLKKEPLYIGVDDQKDQATVEGLEQVGIIGVNMPWTVWHYVMQHCDRWVNSWQCSCILPKLLNHRLVSTSAILFRWVSLPSWEI